MSDGKDEKDGREDMYREDIKNLKEWLSRTFKVIEDNSSKIEGVREKLDTLKEEFYKCKLESGGNLRVPIRVMEQKIKDINKEQEEIKKAGNKIEDIPIERILLQIEDIYKEIEYIKKSYDKTRDREQRDLERKEERDVSIKREKIRAWGIVLAAVLGSSGITFLLTKLFE